MAARYYSLSELKELALDSANVIPVVTAFESADTDKAYDFAVGRCGFENPALTDSDYSKKQHFLLQAMELHFLNAVLKQNLLKFDVGDLKLSQATKEIRRMLEGIDASLTKAAEDPSTAALFTDAVAYFGQIVHGAQITDDAVGKSIDPDEAT